MKQVKIIIVITLVLILFVSSGLSAKKIGVLWFGKSGMADRVYSGFESRIKTLAPDAEIEIQKALPGQDEAVEVYTRFLAEKDGIVFLRSNGAKYMANNPPSVPGFIGGCNNPAVLGVVPSMDANPDKNITGVTYFIDASAQFQIIKSIFPNVKNVCLLLTEGHPSSPIDKEGTMKVCQENGLSYSEVVAKDKESLLAGVNEKKGNTDLFIVSSTALVIDNTADVITAAGTVPVVSYAEKSVRNGALAGLVPSDNKLGELLAESVFDVLYQSKAISTIKIKVDNTPTPMINKTTMIKLGIEIPTEIIEIATFVE